MNNTKIKEIINSLMYIFLPFIMIVLYPVFRSYAFGSNSQNGAILLYGLWIINAICICVVSHIEIMTYKKLFLWITVIYVILFGSMYLRLIFPIHEILLSFTNLFIWSEDIVHIWFACYLYCLFRIIKNNIEIKKK